MLLMHNKVYEMTKASSDLPVGVTKTDNENRL